MNEAREEFSKLLNPEPSTEAPAEQAPAAPTVEEIEYYLGDKAFKLPTNAEFAFKHDGKLARAPLGTVLNHYRQRADLEGKYGQYKKEKEAFEAQLKEFGDLTPYRTIQKWSQENPKDFEYLYQLYENRNKHLLERDAGSPANPQNQALVEKISELEKQLQEFGQFKSSFDQREEERLNEAALKEIETEITSFQKEWPEIKLDEKSNGRSLRDQIILFGVDNKIPDFETAALKFLKPKLLEIVRDRGRTEAVKGVTRDFKSGIIGRSSQPQNGKGEVNPKRLSWSEATNAAKADFLTALRG